MNKLKLSHQKYQTNGNIRYQNYMGKFLFPMKDFVSFSTYRNSIYFMSNKIIKDKINEFCVLQFKLAYICGTTHPLHGNLNKFCCEVYCM